ncbi:MAG: hypothetical protein IJJ00_01335 [Erysipelotrichaceae bacterium]|nr:hypothetical protein [Erysipelotrichaceae bacterium]
MESWQIIIAISSFCIAAVILSYVNKTRKKTGPILSQAYFSLSEEERKYFDRNAEYERLTILYGLIACFFICVALCILTLNRVFGFIGIGFLIVAVIYSLIKIIELKSRR